MRVTEAQENAPLHRPLLPRGSPASLRDLPLHDLEELPRTWCHDRYSRKRPLLFTYMHSPLFTWKRKVREPWIALARLCARRGKGKAGRLGALGRLQWSETDVGAPGSGGEGGHPADARLRLFPFSSLRDDAAMGDGIIPQGVWTGSPSRSQGPAKPGQGGSLGTVRAAGAR